MTTPANTRSAVVGGALLIGAGVLLLLGQLFEFNAWRWLWPFGLVALGGLFFVGMVAGGRAAAGLAMPGSLITTIGLLLLYQNFTGHWGSWSYGWTLIIAAIGLGLVIMGVWGGDARHRETGVKVLGVGAALFVVFGGVFEMGAQWLGWRDSRQVLFPILLIMLGGYLLISRLWPRRSPPPIQ